MVTAQSCTVCGRTHKRNGQPVALATTGKHIGWCETCRWHQTKTGRKRRAMRDSKNTTTTAQDEYNKRGYQNYIARRRDRLARKERQAPLGTP